MKPKMIKAPLVTLAFLPFIASAHSGHVHGTVEAEATHGVLWAAGLVLILLSGLIIKMKLKKEHTSDQDFSA